MEVLDYYAYTHEADLQVARYSVFKAVRRFSSGRLGRSENVATPVDCAALMCMAAAPFLDR